MTDTTRAATTRPAPPATGSGGTSGSADPASSTWACPASAPGPRSTTTGRRTPTSIADCVHCGFCLPTCPTYALWGEEMDSPRGRIHLMKQGLEGEPLTDSMVGHFDACLGCMACVHRLPLRACSTTS